MALRSKKAAAILLILLAALFLTVYLWRNGGANKFLNSSDEKNASENIANIALIENGKIADKFGKQASSAASSYLLPPMNKPIVDVFDDLKLASDKGEAKATCRLAIELLRCQLSLQQDEKELEKQVTFKYQGKTEEELLGIRKSDIEALDFYRECKKLPADKLTDTADLLERAANQHQQDAMVMWASGEWIKARHGNANTFLQDPAFHRWLQNAIPMMNGALQQGSYSAAREWVHAYMMDTGPFFYGLVKDDPKQMYVYVTLGELLENDIPTPLQGMSAQDAMAAEAEGRRMFKDLFDGTPIGKENLSKARIMLDRHDESQRDFCNAKP